ncbi:MAG: AAA family ATPase [Polyangiales bacterium]
MQIRRFWARGYRSLRELVLDPTGPFNIFYGPNGSGKSNILDALDALHRSLGVVASERHGALLNTQSAGSDMAREKESAAGRAVCDLRILREEDVTRGLVPAEMALGARWAFDPADQRRLGYAGASLEVELCFSAVNREAPRLWLSRVAIDEHETPDLFERVPGGIDALLALLRRTAMDFARVDAARFPADETLDAPGSSEEPPVRSFLHEGKLKNALFAASTSRDHALRDRWKAYRSLLQGPPLCRPEFDITLDPVSKALDVRELLDGGDVSIQRVGLGVAQLYAALAGIMLSNSDIVAIEEPEAHLHAPTTGRQFRELLLEVVRSNRVDQLFIATHSNLFDLDPEGYWDVSVREGDTIVQRKPLSEIDRLHLYEPGPAKHALLKLLRYAPDDEVVFRRPDGSPVTAVEMQRSLQEDDATALAFLETLHGAALRVVRLGARIKDASA